MFKKILIANRGEIAVRIIHTCREMNIPSVALYEAVERDALHVRSANEAVLLKTGFSDAAAIVEIAQQVGADAIHPGYGFMAEEASFIRACTAAGITFIGGPADVLDHIHDKVAALETVQAAGFKTVISSGVCATTLDEVQAAAEALGYPVVIKSCYGGRGPGERLVRRPEALERRLRSAQAESKAVFGTDSIFLEKALLPANQVGVQLLVDRHGSIVHLGEREGSWQYNNHRLIEESPAPCLNESQRTALWETAIAIAQLFRLENAATVEFMVDSGGQFYFTEIKARIQTEHPLSEMRTGLDLIREQIRIAAGEPLGYTQADVTLRGHAVLCRIHAEDPLNQMRSSPGQLNQVRLPVGAHLRVDTLAFPGCLIPEKYGSLIAKLTTWGRDRAEAIARTERGLHDFIVTGLSTDRTLLLNALHQPDFISGHYSTETGYAATKPVPLPDEYYRDLAALAAILYVERYHSQKSSVPERYQSGWHRSRRDL